MDQISGIPAHPLFVHIPVVLIPLAAIGAVVMLVKQAWFERYKWALLAVVGAGALGAILAAGSGESLEETSERSAGIHEHAEAGEMARNVSLLFLLVVLAWIFVPILLKRRAASGSHASGAGSSGSTPGWFRIGVAVAVAIVGVGSAVAVVDAGHSGAKQVWNEDEAHEGDEHEGDEHEEEGDEDGAPTVVVDHVVTSDVAS